MQLIRFKQPTYIPSYRTTQYFPFSSPPSTHKNTHTIDVIQQRNCHPLTKHVSEISIFTDRVIYRWSVYNSRIFGCIVTVLKVLTYCIFNMEIGMGVNFFFLLKQNLRHELGRLGLVIPPPPCHVPQHLGLP